MNNLQWQYNGADKWSTIIEWCKEEIPGQWSTDRYETIYFDDTIYFANEEAYSYFLLRWI
jgi:hypothetical protein